MPIYSSSPHSAPSVNRSFGRLSPSISSAFTFGPSLASSRTPALLLPFTHHSFPGSLETAAAIDNMGWKTRCSAASLYWKCTPGAEGLEGRTDQGKGLRAMNRGDRPKGRSDTVKRPKGTESRGLEPRLIGGITVGRARGNERAFDIYIYVHFTAMRLSFRSSIHSSATSSAVPFTLTPAIHLLPLAATVGPTFICFSSPAHY